MARKRLAAILILVVAVAIGYFVYASQEPDDRFAFKLGLDLAGGTHLVYRADISAVAAADVDDAMQSLRDVIERRVNLFGVSEPLVQIEQGGLIAGDHKLIVELPGVTDITAAVDRLGKTPELEFQLIDRTIAERVQALGTSTTPADLEGLYIPTGLSGRLLKRAQLEFDQTTGEPVVSVAFNDEGKDLFANITKDHVGEPLVIFLDGTPISQPVIREEIRGGTAQISGGFTPDEAKTLVRDLNYGALPLPIVLSGTESIGATLGEEAVRAGIFSGIIALIVIAVFLIVWYRLPGVVAVLALLMYIVLNLAIFKLIPVTLTAAGLAGFILSLGMAVDANILIFERMKEEIRKGRILSDAMHEGFARAWLSIRDSNLSSLITAIILFYLAPTPIVRGFALVFAIGVLTSMFTAITASRLFLYALDVRGETRASRFLFGSGIGSHASVLIHDRQ